MAFVKPHERCDNAALTLAKARGKTIYTRQQARSRKVPVTLDSNPWNGALGVLGQGDKLWRWAHNCGEGTPSRMGVVSAIDLRNGAGARDGVMIGMLGFSGP
jgi:hypothetical protein